MKVGQARKKYGITYPTLYAPPGHKDEKVSCLAAVGSHHLQRRSVARA